MLMLFRSLKWVPRLLTRYDVGLFVLCLCFFLIWPNFDLQVSQLFFDNVSFRFEWANHPVANFIYTSTHLIATAVVIFLLIFVTSSFLIKSKFLKKHQTCAIFLLSACLLGPGLLVNVVLKDNWGRPRPVQISEFGGEENYAAPLSPNSARENCRSFVSGHASIGFFFFAFALLSRKKKWLVVPILAGSLVGVTRIVQGGHFFSDVLFSGWAVWFCTLILFTLLMDSRLPHVEQTLIKVNLG